MIAISTLLWLALLVFGLLLTLFGALMMFAAMMSSAPGDGTALKGLLMFLAGAGTAVFALIGVLT